MNEDIISHFKNWSKRNNLCIFKFSKFKIIFFKVILFRLIKVSF
ncbi:hypothetical protein M153_17560002361 [Pseudoloma neurophilia]|uniref:Uncharacterized protein n=1 Tax=Pseudoloma neurophilia TaxID=146866 RepID=A0A0R0M2J7_9MICR|nr:hypothetical protein M153_17560002361 [Pseudoloma neurophilia]